MAEPAPKRKKRFERDKSVKMRLTKRDLDIVRLIYHHRFLNSDQIIALTDGGRKSLLNRLHLLFHAGYLDRPRVQRYRDGNFPMVYALGNLGAEALASEFGWSLGSVDWTSKNRDFKDRQQFEHTLMVSEILTIFRLACRASSGVEFISQEEIIEKRLTPPSKKDKLLSWKVIAERPSYTGKEKKMVPYSVVPDGAFGLRYEAERNGKAEDFFFIEADRSTMPINSSNLSRSSYNKKLIGYYESWKDKYFIKNFGFDNVRIITFAKSVDRIESMINANIDIDPYGKGLALFWFAPQHILDINKPHSVFADNTFMNGRGEHVGLLD